jgi:CheY-like chemotaxis protein
MDTWLVFPDQPSPILPILEVIMPVTVVLAVGLDSSLLASQSSLWQSAGYVVTSTGSIREAIVYIRDGDFDLVLLGHSIPDDSRERFAFLVKAIGPRTPVVSITDSANHRDKFADATVRNEPISLLQCIGEVMAERSRSPMASRALPGVAA